MKVPDGLAWWRSVDGGAEWLARLPSLVEACARDWQLHLEEPFEPASISLVMRCRKSDDTNAVLKINFPEDEHEFEGDALRDWHGVSATLLAENRELRALLLERLNPGFQLWTVGDDDDATRIAAALLRRLWIAPHPRYRLLSDDAGRWAQQLPIVYEKFGAPFERALLDEAIAACAELAPSQRELVLCHRDLHGGNILKHHDSWRVIDPKPIAAEKEFDIGPILRDRPATLTKERIERRLDILVDELAIDRERARRWALTHVLAWAHDRDGFNAAGVETARLFMRAR